MAKFPTIREMTKDVAERALDEYEYKGKTIRQWVTMLCRGDCVEVVRCKDCKYFNHKEMECQCDGVVQDLADSASYRLNFYFDDYCSYGIRKENDNA